MCKLCSLHVHSEYSSIDGVSRLRENCQAALDLGMEHIGLTDHGVVAGHPEFAKVAQKMGVKPIFGMEGYHGSRMGETFKGRDQAHLIILAQTDEGLKNLWRLSNRASQEDHAHFVDRFSWADLEEFREGLIITSACPLGLVAKQAIRGEFEAANRYLELFKDNFFIELTTYPGDAVFEDRDSDEPTSPRQINQILADWAYERGVGVVYGDDGHYANKDLFKAHDAYVAKATGQSIYTPISERKMYHPENALVIKSEQEVRDALSYLGNSVVDEALANSVLIAESCNASLPGIRRHLPVFIPDESPWVQKGLYEDERADQLFIDLVNEGLERCYGDAPPKEAADQTIREVETFLGDGDLYHYFLAGWDMMQFVEDKGIEKGPGRGSSAGCIVARELGITEVDPIRHDLSFERFWNAGRADGFPDIDFDFQQSSRGDIKAYLAKRWGDKRVRSIGTTMRMKPIDLLKKFAPTFGLLSDEEATLKKFLKEVPDIEILGSDQVGWSEEHEPGKVVYVMHSTDETPHDVGDRILDWVETLTTSRQNVVIEFLQQAAVLCNRTSGYGVHPSGVVISDVDLDDELPCRFAYGTQRVPVTQFPMEIVDKRMFIKFDILGLKTLDILSNWKAQMFKSYGIEINWDQLEWEDEYVELWEQLHEGLSAGGFQVEDGYAKRLSKQFKPKSVSDASIIVALNRPGPIRSGTPDKFIRRRFGQEEVSYAHPILEDILNETYGEFLYQEEVIKFFSALGYSMSDADAIRKILGKKLPEKWAALYNGTEEWEGKSYVQACKAAGISETIASKIWAQIVNFAKYSFNKAHSVAYGTILFRTMFAKYYGYPEFIAACITEVPDPKRAERIPAYVGEARRKGHSVYPPDIDNSESLVAVRDQDIYLGFSNIKGVKTPAAEFAVGLREERVPMGTPEDLGEYLDRLSKERAKENAARKKQGLPPLEGKSPKQKLTSGQISALYTAGAWERREGYQTPIRELQAREKEMLQVVVTDQTEEVFERNQEHLEDCDDWSDLLLDYSHDTMYTVPGAVQSIREVQTRKTKADMAIITMEYQGDVLEFAVFPNEWVTHRFLWQEKVCGIFKIRHSLNPNNGEVGYNFQTGYKIA